MITLEISPDATEDFFAYRCHLYGDLYEIAANTDGIEQNLNKGDSDWVLANPKAPPGFYYKQLNEEGSEIMLDIMGELFGAKKARADGQMSRDESTPTCSSRQRRTGSPMLRSRTKSTSSGQSRTTRQRRLPGYCRARQWLQDLISGSVRATIDHRTALTSRGPVHDC